MSDITVIKRLLAPMHCSRCRGEFDGDSIKIMRDDKGLLVFQVKCENCKKCFGMAFLGLDLKDLENSLNLNESENLSDEPISYDDVLNAHHFFQNLDENWMKYIK